jgi:hypothetical protein
MPTVQNITSVAASSVNDNLLTGSQFERMQWPGRVDFGLNGDANGADMRVDVYSGNDVLMENAPLNALARLPIWPDDFQLTDVAGYMEQLKIRVRNTSAAGARSVYWVVKITPIPLRRR